MPEIAVDPVWIATNQRTLHEAVGIALIAAGRQDVWESWHDSMREKYGYPTQWNGETLMGEAKKIVRKCGRKWKECKAEYDKRLAEMLTLRQRRR